MLDEGGSDQFVVITGGPGSGKTTLLDELAAGGLTSTVEAGRGIIRDQLTVSGSALPWADRELFAELMLSWEMRSYRWAQQQSGVVLFDRAVPDVVGYLRLVGLPVPTHVWTAAQTFRYHHRVLITPPWPAIFGTDSERKQDIDEAARTYDAMVTTYTELGYELITVPRADVASRVKFVADRIPALGTAIAE